MVQVEQREGGDGLKARPRGLAGRIRSLFSSGPKRARLPDNLRVYAVGDIHGCAAELDRLMEAIRRDRQGWPGECDLVFLGDYVDRGPDSKGVLTRLLSPPEGFRPTYLLGNHDQTVLDFLEDASLYRSWRDFGGRETLLSYGVTPPLFDDPDAIEVARQQFRAALPAPHLEFLRALQLSIRIGDYFFVHAGVRPGLALERQAKEDLLWIRDEFLTSSQDLGAVIVHGHTPTHDPIRRSNRIGVDTGVYATGQLTAAVLEGEDCRFLSS